MSADPTVLDRLRPYAKAIVAVLTVLATILAAVLPFLGDGQTRQVVMIVLVALGAVGVYRVPNRAP